MLNILAHTANDTINKEFSNHMADSSHWSSNMTFMILGFTILVIAIISLLWFLREHSGTRKTD